MINVNNISNLHFSSQKSRYKCPYCNGTEYSSTGLVNANGIEIACDSCGQIYYINPKEIENYGNIIGYGF